MSPLIKNYATELEDIPKILSVDVSSESIPEGTKIKVIVQAKSNSPVDWISSSLKKPNGDSVYGGGHEAKFDEVADVVWEYSWTNIISKYAPSGIYKYERVSVENMNMMKSKDWQPIEIIIKNSIPVEVPELLAVNTKKKAISEGTEIEVVIIAKSNSPVDWISSSLKKPNGDSVYGGGHGTNFNEVSDGVWEYSWTNIISKYAPSGVYTYERISVENMGMQKSNDWQPIEIIIENNIPIEVPELVMVSAKKKAIVEGTEVKVTVLAKSNSPVDWINTSLRDPNGENVYGGGHGTKFNEVSDGVWEYSWTDIISKYAPSGVYTYERISVENMGMEKSSDWQELEVLINHEILPPLKELEVIAGPIDIVQQ